MILRTDFSAVDDDLHAVSSEERLAVETMWWNFYSPGRNLDGEIYICFRPNLGITYAGIYVWDDFCRHHADALVFDAQSYLPLPTGNLNAFSLENGFQLTVLRPLKLYEMSYRDGFGVELTLRFEALCGPVAVHRAPEADADKATYAPGHFDQVGRMKGRLAIHGEMVEIDCITHRDRSWGAVRVERPGYPPDVDWHSAHFGEDFSLQCWLWHQEPESTDLQSGVVYKQGRPVPLQSARRSVVRDTSGLEPRRVTLDVVDVEGERFVLQGQLRNLFPWPGWLNMVGFAGLVEWRLGDRIGYGEVHDGRTISGSIARKRSLRRGLEAG